MKFIPITRVLDLDKSEVKTIIGYLQMDIKMNENLIKKVIKYGNKIPEGNKIEKEEK